MKKFKRILSVTLQAFGVFSLLFFFAIAIAWVCTDDTTVSPNKVTNQLDSDNEHIPENVIVKSKVQEIKSVPLYGYAYKVSKHMYITNFSRLNVKVGSTVKFRVTGAVKVGDAYLVNADYE